MGRTITDTRNGKSVPRIIAVCLAALLFTVSALAAGGATVTGGAGNGVEINLSGFSTMLDVSGRMTENAEETASGEINQFFKSYAFAEQGEDALIWKDIPLDSLTVGLRWDISKLVSTRGTLVISSAAAKDNPAENIGDCKNEEGAVCYAAFVITDIAPVPAPIGKDKISYRETFAYIETGAGTEWSKDGYVWYSSDANGPDGADKTEKWCRIPLSAKKQTVYVRGGAKTGENVTLPSLKSVKVSIPAIPKAPKVKIYLSQGFISARTGMEISNDGKTWGRMTANTIPLGTVTELPSPTGGADKVRINLNDDWDVYIRNPAGGGKPASDTFETRIKIRDAGSVTADHFIHIPNMTLLIDSSVVIEAFIDGKWKTVKKIADVPAGGLKVRRAGAKDRMPGSVSILRLISNGEYKTVSVDK